ncbi:hypothetical protein [Chryseobacterium polytrichastri]|uniref:Uncharacterized protein n=1 Tax=Chryseobacterium polytrichastri TaxID=1302687 RepID=A0A1M7BSE9_9FLAO|nr:hypothetical protein [Chryseobacterium polytrichastri]SHL57867.1 hypothetical protein SAMN05444267_102070 [Chryseobacterium polytrichastri]
MNKKRFIVPLVIVLGIAIYVVFYHKDKTLKFVPKDADVVVIIDVKKLTRQYVSSFIMYPSQWFGSEQTHEDGISLQDSGMKIPDFLQIFHVKNSKFSNWYSVVKLKDQQKFLTFLKKQRFINKGRDLFQKDRFFIKIEGNHCILGTSNLDFESIQDQLFHSSGQHVFNANQFIENTTGSISFISGSKIQNFSIELNADDIEIKNRSNSENFNSILSKLEQKNSFLEMELDAQNIKKYTSFFNKSIADSSQINYVKASVELEQVSDTILSYGYDDNFNEIEKKTYQKIVQPNYVINLQSTVPETTWQYFLHRKWINAQNQFTIIPFQPNSIAETKNGFEIKSTRKSVHPSPNLKENYIFVRNSVLLSSSLSTLTDTEKNMISNLDYIFYGNKGQDYYIKCKAKKENLPLILRW